MLNQTTIIILKKQPYQESNFLLEGITPDFGRLSLILYGGQKIGGKKFPAADLFQEFDLSFEGKDSRELHSAKDFDLRTDCGGIADSQLGFKFAGKMAKFLLKNSQPDLPMPLTYDAARNSFVHLSEPENTPGKWTLEECAVAFKITFLYENGYLPEPSGEQQNNVQECLISSAVEGTGLNISPEYCHQLNLWLNTLLEYHKIEK